MPNLLEVIALDAQDAVAAVRGGADRLELVHDMSADGLTPGIETFAEIRDAVDVPLRVMLRTNGGFTIEERDLETLCTTASALHEAGMQECVVGFLTGEGEVDMYSLVAVLGAAQPAVWTFHRAFDYAADPAQAWQVVATLPGVDAVLTAGSPSGVDLDGLTARLGWEDGAPPWVVGGGLREEHIGPLRAAGLNRFHVGSRVRHGHSWQQPVDPDAVRKWRGLVDADLALANRG